MRRVNIDSKIERRLRKILSDHVKNSNEIEPYETESSDHDDQVLVHQVAGTDFAGILLQVAEGSKAPLITNLEELSNAWATLIVAYPFELDPVIAFRRAPEGWNLKKLGGFYNAIWQENKLVNFDDKTVLRLDQKVDFIGFEDQIFILSKKSFEAGLNFRHGMESKRDRLLDGMQSSGLFQNIDVLKEKCGSNFHILRRVVEIEKIGYYKDPAYMKTLETVAAREGWSELEFVNGQLLLSADNVSHVLSVLCDRRMQSMVKKEIFDVEGSVRAFLPKIVGKKEAAARRR